MGRTDHGLVGPRHCVHGVRPFRDNVLGCAFHNRRYGSGIYSGRGVLPVDVVSSEIPRPRDQASFSCTRRLGRTQRPSIRLHSWPL
jgi:hypothetical protein